MPLISQRKVCAVKQESVIGTGVSLTNTEVIPILDVVLTPSVTLVATPRNGALGNHKSSVTAFSGQAVITLEATGLGSSGLPKWATALLPACGMVATDQVYAFSSAASDAHSVTIGAYHDGIFTRLVGCMGSFVFTSATGSKPQFVFTLQGAWDQSYTDVAMLTPASVISPGTARSATVTFDAYSPMVSSWSFDAGNSVSLRPDHTTSTGYRSAWIGTRLPTISADPETSLVAIWDLWGKLRGATEIDAQYVLNGGSNNTITFDCPNVQVTSAPLGDRNSTVVTNFAGQCNEDSPTITFS